MCGMAEDCDLWMFLNAINEGVSWGEQDGMSEILAARQRRCGASPNLDTLW